MDAGTQTQDLWKRACALKVQGVFSSPVFIFNCVRMCLYVAMRLQDHLELELQITVNQHMVPGSTPVPLQVSGS